MISPVISSSSSSSSGPFDKMAIICRNKPLVRGGSGAGEPAPHECHEGFIGSKVALLPPSHDNSFPEQFHNEGFLADTRGLGKVYINSGGEVKQRGLAGETDNTEEQVTGS